MGVHGVFGEDHPQSKHRNFGRNRVATVVWNEGYSRVKGCDKGGLVGVRGWVNGEWVSKDGSESS